MFLSTLACWGKLCRRWNFSNFCLNFLCEGHQRAPLWRRERTYLGWKLSIWLHISGETELHKLVTDVFLYMVNKQGSCKYVLTLKNMSMWSHCDIGPYCIWLFKQGGQFNWMVNLILVKFKWALGAMSPLSHILYQYKCMIYLGSPLVRFPTRSQ